MVAEVFGGLAALKSAFDLAKGLKDINDGAVRNATLIELQGKILTAQAEQSSMIEQLRELRDEVTRLKNWEEDKKRYQLQTLPPGNFRVHSKSEYGATRRTATFHLPNLLPSRQEINSACR